MTISSRIAFVGSLCLAAALFYAPAAYGCTRPDMLPPLFVLLGICIATGFAVFMARGGGTIPRVELFCVAAILIQGWWMTWHPGFSPAPSEDGGSGASPETIHRLSFDSMTVTSILLGTFLVLGVFFRDPKLRRIILVSVALSGVAISVAGIVLKIVGEPLTRYVWSTADNDWNDFAFYRYHGNAGAFLNLAWPLILVFTRRAYTPMVGLGPRIGWTLSAVACGTALFLNASKASLIIGLLILPWPFLTWLTRLNRRTLLMLVAACVLLIGAALWASLQLSYDSAFQRMTNTSEVSESFDGRMAAYQQYVSALPASGFFGFGPGLFQVAFPYQTSPLGNIGVGVREFAHEDYLQAVLEWGWVGTLWWFVLVAGGIRRGIRTYARRELFASKTDRHLLLAALLGVGGTLVQALIDFPLEVTSIRLFFFVLLALCWTGPAIVAPPREKEFRRGRLPVLSSVDDAPPEPVGTESSDELPSS